MAAHLGRTVQDMVPSVSLGIVDALRSVLETGIPVVQGAVLVVSAIFIVSNLLVDLLYVLIDPRIRYE